MAALTASPFHPATGTLMPVYLEAYLIGDLAPESMLAVTEYLRTKPNEAELARERWLALQASGELPPSDTLPWAAPAGKPAIVVPVATRSTRWRLPSLRMFGLMTGFALVGLTAYGLDLVKQQQQADKAGPVFQRTEQQMENASAAVPVVAQPAQPAQ